jgi:hypothetical protein
VSKSRFKPFRLLTGLALTAGLLAAFMLPHQAVAAQVSPHDQVWAGDMAQEPAPGIIGLDAGRSAPAGSCYAPEGWKLVTIGDDLSQDKVYTYAGRPMYWTGGSSYAGGEGAVFVTLVKNYDPAKIKVQKAARPGLIYGDVNGNGRIDIADVHTICLLSADPHCFDAAGTAVFSVKGRLSAGLLGLQKPTTDDANQVLSIFNSL